MLAQGPLESGETACLQIFCRRDSQFSREYALQMKAAHPRQLAQRCQRDFAVGIGFHETAQSLYQRRLSRQGVRRFAAQTCPQARLLSLMWRIKEPDILAQGTPRRARWAAIDASAQDAENKRAIQIGISLHHCLPAPLV